MPPATVSAACTSRWAVPLREWLYGSELWTGVLRGSREGQHIDEQVSAQGEQGPVGAGPGGLRVLMGDPGRQT